MLQTQEDLSLNFQNSQKASTYKSITVGEGGNRRISWLASHLSTSRFSDKPILRRVRVIVFQCSYLVSSCAHTDTHTLTLTRRGVYTTLTHIHTHINKKVLIVTAQCSALSGASVSHPPRAETITDEQRERV